jgi:plasmid stabilization system protein ParE
MQVRFADAALTDLEHIRSFIAGDKPAAANRVASPIIDATDRLAANPRLGRIGAMTGTFEIVVRPYVIVYEINRDQIVVLRVRHGRQRRPGT